MHKSETLFLICFSTLCIFHANVVISEEGGQGLQVVNQEKPDFSFSPLLLTSLIHFFCRNVNINSIFIMPFHEFPHFSIDKLSFPHFFIYLYPKNNTYCRFCQKKIDFVNIFIHTLRQLNFTSVCCQKSLLKRLLKASD